MWSVTVRSIRAMTEKLDKFGAWNEDGDEGWLPKEFHPTRGKAKIFSCKEFGFDFLELRCETQWVRPIERTEDNAQDYFWWCDVLWIDCGANHPEAVEVWHIYV